MTSVRDRLTDAAYALGWTLVCRVPESWARGAFQFGADIFWRRQGPQVQVLEANLRRVTGPSATGKELRALSRQTMRSYARYWLESFRLPVLGQDRIQADMHVTGEEKTAGEPGRGPRGDHRPAAHRQLRAGRRLDHPPRGGEVHHGRRAAQARVPVQAVPGFPRGPRHGGAPGQRRGQPVRRAGPAAAGRGPGLPGLRPGRHRPRHRGGVLRGEGADDGRPGRAGRADRGGAAARHLVVRRRRLGGPHLRRGPGPAGRHPPGEGRGHDPGGRPRLRGRDPGPSAGLAHAPEGLRRGS